MTYFSNLENLQLWHSREVDVVQRVVDVRERSRQVQDLGVRQRVCRVLGNVPSPVEYVLRSKE
jgi:hypothetical protein